MKIIASDVRFNTQQQAQSSEQYARQSSSGSVSAPVDGIPVVNQVDLSYSAKMRAQDSSTVDASSTVKRGYDRATFHKNQATHSVTQTVIGLNASVQNISINDNSPSLLAPTHSGTYKNIEQLSLTDAAESQARLEIKEQYSFTQQQQLHVGTQGKVTTEDGREIDFLLQLEMNRDFSLEESLHVQSSQRALMDPLVINLSGGAASLTSHSFSFDLNADGKNEQISFVGSGSGFLAIDNNSDGRINDGSELFGTGGKNGFAQLSQYDLDNNKWIDENDEIFSKLKVWTKDAAGIDQLVDLKTAGVGAIYLGAAAASFDLRDGQNNLLGQVKRSGVFLTERGEVASIQELDIAVREDTSSDINHVSAIELQLEEWDRAAPAINNPVIDLNSDATSPAMFAKDEDKQPTLLDILFPPAGSKYDYISKDFISVDTQTSTTTIIEESASDPSTANRENTLFVDPNSFASLQDLGTKTQTKLDREEDKLSHLRAIIDSLHKQHFEQRTSSKDKV